MAPGPQTMTPNNVNLHALGLTPLQPGKVNRSKPRAHQVRQNAEHVSQLRQTYRADDGSKIGKLPPLKNSRQVYPKKALRNN